MKAISKTTVSYHDVQNAEKTIREYVKETPLVRSNFLSNLCGGEVYLKLENKNITNSFKIRGALNKMQSLSESERKKGVVTASAGNHGIAVALISKQLGIQATIVVPENTPNTKTSAILANGARLIKYGKSYDDAELKAYELEKQTQATFVSPYNDKQVVAGAGTIGIEIMNQLPSADVLLVPMGAGALAAGIAIAAKAANPAVKVFGINPNLSPVMHESLKQGHLVNLEIGETIAEGVSGNVEAGAITFPICQRVLDGSLVVDEQVIRQAVKLLYLEDNQLAEGAGALGPAALIQYPEMFRGKTVVAVISGGNMDKELLDEILNE